MKKSDYELISRGIDGELDAGERKRLVDLLASDPEAAREQEAWRAIGDHVRRATENIPAPDAGAAWMDIRRAIREQESPAGDRTFPFGWRAAWAGALAASAVIGLLGWSALRLATSEPAVEMASVPAEDRVEWVVAEIPGATTMIYSDLETDMTVIWMDVAQDIDPRDT